jgi:CheY-like chemotaxis protein
MTETPVTTEACVLIVDDEEDIRDTLREVVEMGGCRALVAPNGVEALRILETTRPCLIILDLMMPGITGNQLLEAIRARPALADVAIVISTSAPERAPAGVPVLKKPIDIGTLWKWMRENCHCAANAG